MWLFSGPVSTSWVCVSSIVSIVFVYHRVQNKLAVAHRIRGPLSWPELEEEHPSYPLLALGHKREAGQHLGLAVVGGRRLPLKSEGQDSSYPEA